MNKLMNNLTSTDDKIKFKKRTRVRTGTRTQVRTDKINKILSHRFDDVTIVLENINDPHNLSACLRSCDAVGIYEIHVVYFGSQKMPKLGKASSASASKWIKVFYYESLDECFDKLRAEGKKIYTTALSEDSVSLYDLDLTTNVAMVFGNEHKGVSDEAIAKADGNFLIPQMGMIQSLNISVAVAVSVYEVLRQKQSKGLYDNLQLNESKHNKILTQWLEK